MFHMLKCAATAAGEVSAWRRYPPRAWRYDLLKRCMDGIGNLSDDPRPYNISCNCIGYEYLAALVFTHAVA
jgi:hypothetical protein